MTGESIEFDHSSENIVSLATAIANRKSYENKLNTEIVEAVTGMPKTPMPVEVRQAMNIGLAVLCLKHIEAPDEELNVDSVMVNLLDDKTFDLITQALGAEDDITDENLDILKQVTRSGLEQVLSLAGQDSMYLTSLTDEITEAYKVATENGIPVEQVYEDDKSYYALMRRLHTPVELASASIRETEKLDPAFMQNFVKTLMTGMLGVDENLDLSPEELNTELVEMFQDEEIRALINELIDKSHYAGYAVVREELKRIWGPDSIHELPEDLKRKLVPLPREILQPQNGDMATYINVHQHRDLVLRTYCQEQGWDMDNLTMEQIRKIRSLPEFNEEIVE